MWTAAQAELLAKGNLNLKLQDLSRKLQQQNKEMKEEDMMQRKLMIENFQSTLNDLKSRWTSTAMQLTLLICIISCMSGMLLPPHLAHMRMHCTGLTSTMPSARRP